MSDMIEVFPNIVDPAICRSLIDILESSGAASRSEIVTGQGGGAESAVRRSTGLVLSPANCGNSLYAALSQAYQKAFDMYRNKYPILRRVSHIHTEAFTLLKYRDDTEHYSWHVDGADAGTRYRFLSIVSYLNTVEAGGETEFKLQNIKIKPQQGAVLIFPSGWTHEHRGLPPQSGSKYIITCWLRFADFPPL